MRQQYRSFLLEQRDTQTGCGLNPLGTSREASADQGRGVLAVYVGMGLPHPRAVDRARLEDNLAAALLAAATAAAVRDVVNAPALEQARALDKIVREETRDLEPKHGRGVAGDVPVSWTTRPGQHRDHNHNKTTPRSHQKSTRLGTPSATSRMNFQENW